MADRRSARSEPTTTSEIEDADWYGHDLSGQSHARVSFIGVELTEATNRGAVFSECTFRDCDFNASTHVDAAFLNCTFAGCSFFDASFSECKPVGSTFDRCRFGGLTVSGGDWSLVGLAGAHLRHAALDGVRM